MLKDLIQRARSVLDQSHPPEQELVDVENALSAFLEALATERIAEPVEFTELEHANRLLREVRRERSRRLAEMQYQEQKDKPAPSQSAPVSQPKNGVNISPSFNDDDTYDPLRKFLSSSHDPEAEALMDSAEEAFYAGNYQKAIPLYESVLQVEPGWSRAKEHRDEAEEFLRTGNIPSVALPPDAGKAYGKAQSAARVFRYQTALDYLDEAFASLKEAGINRWREGEELRQDLENQMQAHDVFEEGLALLRQGDLQAGLSKVQTAASAVALPEYVDKAAEIRSDIAALDEIADVMNLSGNIPPDKLADARTRLDRLSIKYGEIPQVSRLRNRMDIVLPAVTSSLLDKVNRFKRQGDASTTLKGAKTAYDAAVEALATLQVLTPDTTQGKALEAEAQESQHEVAGFGGRAQTGCSSFEHGKPFLPPQCLYHQQSGPFTLPGRPRSAGPQAPIALVLHHALWRWWDRRYPADPRLVVWRTRHCRYRTQPPTCADPFTHRDSDDHPDADHHADANHHPDTNTCDVGYA